MARIDLLRQLARFGIVGVMATLVHAGCFHAIYQIGWKQSSIVANLLAFSAAFAVSLVGHFLWTFHAEARQLNSRLMAGARFFQVTLLGLGINLLAGWVLIDRLGYHYYFYLLVLVFITPSAVFLLNKYWVFRLR